MSLSESSFPRRLLLVITFLILSASGFRLQSQWLVATRTKRLTLLSRQSHSPLQSHQYGQYRIEIPRGGSSDVVLDLLAEDDDETEEDDEDDDGDDNNDELQASNVRDETVEEEGIQGFTGDDVEGEEADNSNNINIPAPVGDEEEDQEDEDDDDDDDLEDQEEREGPLVAVSSQPISIVFKTNMGNPLIDSSLELLVSRSRTVENVKQSLSRMLPGRPPVEVMRLVSEGLLLQDDQLIDDIVDEEDEDEEDNEGAPSVTMIIDMVPPVDPKFATQLHKMNEMSTSELLDAYAANAAAMYHTTSEEDQPGDLLSVQLRHEAHEIREQLLENFPEKALAAMSMETPSAEVVEDRRGQRHRTSTGGARANLKRILQTNLNINWAGTIRNFLLFLFFGLFGGRSTISRNLLLLGAPMCFVLQARVVKIYLKLAFYACAHPPSIFLSLLPAPQQAILSFNEEEARKVLYPEPISTRKKGEKEAKKKEEVEEDEEDDDDE